MHKMPAVKLYASRSVLVLIDIQPVLTKTIYEMDRVLCRAAFLANIANLLGVPVLATEQNPSRMGAIDPHLSPLVSGTPPIAKMSFSAVDCPEFVAALEATGRSQVIVVGVETHICVSQTACDLLMSNNYEVVVSPDAVSSRTQDRHKLGMERIRDAGIVPAHTEAIAYEWLGTASHPLFKPALQFVKGAP